MRFQSVVGVMVVVFAQASCNSGAVECGVDTVEINGVCESVFRAGPPNTCCGPNTSWDPTLLVCVGEASVVCDPDTTSEVTDDNGVTTCFGQAECGRISCANAAPGKVNVCGQLADIETSARLDLGAGGLCDSANPADDGPCSLELSFYDALAFAQNPTGATPLTYDRLRVNECGWFAAEGIPAPQLGFLGIGLDDADADDDHVLTGVALPVSGGQRVDDITVYATRLSSVQMWTDSAGMPFGAQNFAERGAYAPIYLHCDQPMPGVTVISGGSPQAANDYYYSDADALMRTTIDAGLSSTGANGSALLVDAELVQHTGSGGDIGTCEWNSALAAAIPGVIFAQEVHTVDPDNGDACPCP